MREQLAREAAPIRAWLDENIDRLRHLSMPALLAQVRRGVPEAAGLPDIQLEGIIREWATLRGISIPRLSLIPVPGVIEIPPPAGPSLADSDFVAALRKVLQIPTSIEIKRPHGRTEIALTGATVELIRGGARLGGELSWGGTMGLFTEVRGVRFEGSLSAERWSMLLSIPAGTPTPAISGLREVFREGERSIRALARETAAITDLRDVSAMKATLVPHLDPVKAAIDAARGTAESGGRRVSFGLGASGPALSPESSAEGFKIQATLTIRF